MERRIAVHAGRHAEALTPPPSRAQRRGWAIAVALVALAGVADAKPKRRDAKAAFDRGVVAYQKANYIGASEQLGRSFALERDVDTLFAWAQSERKLERCDKAIELYEQLLTFKLPPANKSAVALKLDECRAVIAAQKPVVDPTPEPVAAEPPPPKPVEPPASAGKLTAPPPVATSPPTIDRPLVVTSSSSSAARPSWYKDPVALALLGSGVAAAGVGTALLFSARSLDRDADAATSYEQALSLSDKAQSRGTFGVVALGAGGALLAGGAIWIVMHRRSPERRTVSGWLAPGGGGLAVAGGF